MNKRERYRRYEEALQKIAGERCDAICKTRRMLDKKCAL
jgi:hypothetical protein